MRGRQSVQAAIVIVTLLAPAVASAQAAVERPWPTRSCVIQERCGPLFCKAEKPPAQGCQARANASGFTLLRTIAGERPVCEFKILLPVQFNCADNPPLVE